MKTRTIVDLVVIAVLGAAVVFIYPKPFAPKHERKILYWTDPMLSGDRSDHPGKSPMGMERVPVYADETTVEQSTETIADSSYYTCPMHPSVRSDRPGACPVCGMALVKKSSRPGATNAALTDLEAVSMAPAQRVMANVTTAMAERKTLKKDVQAAGVVDFAEPNVVHISMRFPGRLDKLYVNFTGQHVRKGDPVAEVYSPQAVSAQQEYLLALDSYTQMSQTGGTVASDAEDLLNQAKRKLELWNFTEKQISTLSKTRTIQYSATIYSPITGTVLKKNVDPQGYVTMGDDIFDVADLSRVWVYLDVYERDIRFVQVGQQVRITTEAYPGETFPGRVTFIDPVLDASTRTVRVRTEFTNPDGRLKPNMFVSARVTVPSLHALVVPASSILSTGKRNVVWVEVQPDQFEPRDVIVGAKTETYAEILGGLSVGDEVAATGGFLIDSESELRHPGATEEHLERRQQSAHTDEAMAHPSDYFKSDEITAKNNEAGILVKGKYTPSIIHVKLGEPVTLHFYRDEDADCTNEVVFEDLGIRRRLPARETTTIVFTPRDTGEVGFACGMGMVRGKLIVGK